MLEIIVVVFFFITAYLLICVKAKKNTELSLQCMSIKFNFKSKNEKNSGCHQSFDKK